jgi:apolipoprotein N-acyltransferase
MNTVIKRRHLYLLSLISGLLLSLGWPARGFPFLLFFGFIPLLFIEDYIYRNKQKFNRLSYFFHVFLSMLVWNILTTYWIYYSTTIGVVLAVVINALFMSITLSLFHYTRIVLKHNSAYIAFIVYWLTFEYLHLNWELSWSWLNIGNGFANYPALIQWYEYTGCFGGTLWILLINYMIFRGIKMYFIGERTARYRLFYPLFSLGLILIPFIISLFIYYNYNEKGIQSNVVIVQPNIDPYDEKFDSMTPEQQLAKLLKLAKQKTSQNTNLLVGPETSIPEIVCEDRLDASNSIDSLKVFIKKYPNLYILL